MARECVKHRMPDGTIMDGPVHGPGQMCVEYSGGVKKGGKIKPKPIKKNTGGYLVGPSHEQGGIPAIVSDGNTPIELEGTEYIINGKATAALGTQFLDKLNATANDYHPNIQGFAQNELPTPSQYEMGGKLNFQKNKQKKKMRRGGNIMGRKVRPIQRKKMKEGGTTCPSGMVLQDGACYKITGNPAKTSKGFAYQTGGGINRSTNIINPKSPASKGRKKLRHSERVRKRIGGSIKKSKPTGVSVGHSHTAVLDEHGNGHTEGNNDHTHTISNGIVSVAFTSNGKGHTHSL